MNNYLRISEVATLKQVCYDTVLLAIKERRLPAAKVLGITVVTREAADAWQPAGGRGRPSICLPGRAHKDPVHRARAAGQTVCGVWHPEWITTDDNAVTCKRCRRSIERKERMGC